MHNSDTYCRYSMYCNLIEKYICVSRIWLFQSINHEIIKYLLQNWNDCKKIWSTFMKNWEAFVKFWSILMINWNDRKIFWNTFTENSKDCAKVWITFSENWETFAKFWNDTEYFWAIFANKTWVKIGP